MKDVEIEKAISSMNSTNFHRLCSAYLNAKFDYSISRENTAKNKSEPAKGTPDTFILLPNGNYVFVEITTQQNNVGNKFIDDLDKCFDATKTGVPLSKIEKVILCYSQKLSNPEIESLNTKCQEHNKDLEIVTLDSLKYDLYNNYKSLVKDFLYLSLDTEQIVSIDKFVSEHQKRATSLENELLGREKELEEVLQKLENYKVVIINGGAGVGKTKLAIEAFKKLKISNSLSKFIGINNKGISIYEDLQTSFFPNQIYYILIDDANRIGDFEYILELKYKENIDVHLIITVRDYAQSKIEELLNKKQIEFEKIDIQPLTDEIVKSILESLEITNSICIDNIQNIAKGNARLVMMAAKLAKETDNCHSLTNVSNLYDIYFSQIIEEISELKDEKILKAMGILSFFRIVEKDDERFKDIYSFFEMNELDFWESIESLHNLELVDLYEKEIVKISDQTLAEYFFYYVFIKREILDLNIILDNFLNSYNGKIKESIYPVLNNLRSQENIDFIIEKVRNKLNNSKDDTTLVIFNLFYFLINDEILFYVQDKVEQCPSDIDNDYVFEKATQELSFFSEPIPHEEYFNLLLLIRGENEAFEIALELIFDYIKKQPLLLPKAITHFSKTLSYNKETIYTGYELQNQTLDFLISKSQENDEFSDIATNILIAISSDYLRYEYRISGGGRKKNTVTIGTILLHYDDSVAKIREKLWNFLITNYSKYPNKIYSVFYKYTTDSIYEVLRNRKEGVIELAKFDREYILKWIEECLDETKFINCFIVQKYLKILHKVGIYEADYDTLETKFFSREYEIFTVLHWDYRERKEDYNFMDREDYKEIKIEEITSYFKDYKKSDYINLVDIITNIVSHEEVKSTFFDWGYLDSIAIMLESLTRKDITICLEVIDYILERELNIIRTPHIIIETFFELGQQHLIKNIIYKYNLTHWKKMYFISMPTNLINENEIEVLLDFFAQIPSGYRIWLGQFLKFKNFDKQIFIKILKVLWKRHLSDPNFEFDLDHTDMYEKYFEDFVEANEIEFAKKFYLYLQSVSTKYNSYFDLDRKGLFEIVKLDDNFIIEFIESILETDGYLSDDSFHLEIIWNLEGSIKIMTRILHFISEKSYYNLNDRFILSFFPSVMNERIKMFFYEFIQFHKLDKPRLKLIFFVIIQKYPDHRIEFLEYLLKYNTDLELFSSLSLVATFRENTSMAFTYEQDKKFWKEVENICKGAKLLKIKQHAKKQQEYCQENIKHHLKRDFSDDF